MASINVDFQVLKTYDPKALLIADTSQWAHIVNKPTIVEITLPGAKNPSVVYWEQGRINVFTSSILGVNCGAECGEQNIELPDGVYHIALKGSPDKFFKERYYLKTDKLQLQFDKVYLKNVGLDLNYHEFDKIDNLQNIDLMLKGADASIRKGEIAMAVDYYKQAKKMIEQYNCED